MFKAEQPILAPGVRLGNTDQTNSLRNADGNCASVGVKRKKMILSTSKPQSPLRPLETPAFDVNLRITEFFFCNVSLCTTCELLKRVSDQLSAISFFLLWTLVSGLVES